MNSTRSPKLNKIFIWFFGVYPAPPERCGAAFPRSRKKYPHMGPLESYYAQKCVTHVFQRRLDKADRAAIRARIARVFETKTKYSSKEQIWLAVAEYANA